MSHEHNHMAHMDHQMNGSAMINSDPHAHHHTTSSPDHSHGGGMMMVSETIICPMHRFAPKES